MLITFQLHNGRVPSFVERYLPYAVSTPFGAGTCYLGIAKRAADEYVPSSVERISRARFYSLLCEADIRSGAEESEPVPLTIDEKRRIGDSFLAGYVDDGELAVEVDWHTGNAIDRSVHVRAGMQEEIGILRDQLVQLLNALGMEATPEFTRLNEVAIAEIQKGRAEKGLAPDGEKTTKLDPSSGLLPKLIAIAAKKG